MQPDRFLRTYRRELVRQYRLVLHAWWWYVLPMFAGLSLRLLGETLRRGESIDAFLWSAMFLATVAVSLVAVTLNLAAARDLKRQIVELGVVD